MSKKPQVFIVEDDPQLSNVFSLTLRSQFDPHPIMDGAEALQRLAETTPDLILLDMNLPGASGLDIFNFLRSDSRFDRTRVILTTADALQAEVLKDRADLVLLKPVSPVQLRELAERLIPLK